jgi:hypothetical protein
MLMWADLRGRDDLLATSGFDVPRPVHVEGRPSVH